MTTSTPSQNKNLRAYLFGDETGQHFEVVAASFDEGCANALDAFKHAPNMRGVLRFQGIRHSLPGITSSPLRRTAITVVCDGWTFPRHARVILEPGDLTQPVSSGMCAECQRRMEEQ